MFGTKTRVGIDENDAYVPYNTPIEARRRRIERAPLGAWHGRDVRRSGPGSAGRRVKDKRTQHDHLNSHLDLPRCAKNEPKPIASSCLSTASRLASASPTRSSVRSRRRSHSPFAHLTSTHPVDAEMCRIAIASNLDLAKQLGTVVQGTVKPSAFFSPSDRTYSNPHSDHAVLYTRPGQRAGFTHIQTNTTRSNSSQNILHPSGAKGTNPRPLINGHMFRVITF